MRIQTYYKTHKERLKQLKKEWYIKNHERELEKARIRRENNPNKYRNYSKKSKQGFLEMYGGKCACCGECIPEFLTIEHKQGQKGIKQTMKRKSTKAYRDAVKNYNPDLYEVLCFNCNCAKGNLGYCPHTLIGEIK